MEIAAFISINVLLFSSWYGVLRGLRDLLLFPDRLIAMFVLGLVQIIATEMVLGVVFQKLFPRPLFIVNAVISLLLIAGAVSKGYLRGAFAEIGEESARMVKAVRGDKILCSLAALFFMSLLWMAVQGYLFPSYAWDALYYHLPMVGQIIQSGAIRENLSPSFIQQYMNIFPQNVDLFFLWNIIFLKSDVLVDLSQLVFTLAGVISVYSMSVKAGIGEKYSLFGALLFFFTPVLILQSTTNYVDAAVSMLFLIAVNFLLYDSQGSAAVLRERGKTAGDTKVPLVLSGLAAGVLMGSKPTGPLFPAVMVLFIVLQKGMERFMPAAGLTDSRGGYPVKRFKDSLLYFILPAAAAGGYWYVKNWVLHGNPVYYMEVSLFGIPVFTGLKSNWVEPPPPVIEGLNYFAALLRVWSERVQYYMYDSRMSGFGPLWFILFLSAFFFAVPSAVKRKNGAFLSVLFILGVAFLLHPRNWTTRYVIFIVAAGALSFGMLMDSFRRQEQVLEGCALALAAYTAFTANSPCIMPSKAAEFLRLPAEERTLTSLKPVNIDEKVRGEYGHWMWIERNVKQGETLVHTFVDATLDTTRPFFLAPYWNRGYSNRVLYVSADTYAEWLEALRQAGATYVLVRKNSKEDGWIEKERKLFYSLRWAGPVTEKFRILYEDKQYRVSDFSGN
ncbi:MAG: hypothetical protein JSU90_10920 [Nitrospiraceae bacterium]|nr:MAG: hypothetical protein JSU90_10920 [Nitrospiraceae bacterium]